MYRSHNVHQHTTRLNINSIPDGLNNHSEYPNPVSEFQPAFKHLAVYKLSQEQGVSKYTVLEVVTNFKPPVSVFIKRGVSTDMLINSE